MFVASDIPAILQYTRKVIVLEEGEVVEVRRDGYALTAFDGKPIDARSAARSSWEASSAEKSGFKHFMLKEIFEQPNVIKETLAGRIDESRDVQLGRGTADRRDRAARDDQDLDHRLRHRVSRRDGRDVSHARAVQDPGRDGAGLGVPLRRPGDGSAHADDRDVAVRRNRRHDRSGQDRRRSRRADHRHLQRRRVAPDAHRRRHAATRAAAPRSPSPRRRRTFRKRSPRRCSRSTSRASASRRRSSGCARSPTERVCCRPRSTSCSTRATR